MPHVVILAGPNGAGKTTAAPHLLKGALGVDTYVNADVIAQGLSGFAPEAEAVRAGRIMLERIQELVRSHRDFAFESTLAGRTLSRSLDRFRSMGYDVHLLYLWLANAEMAVERVRLRVRTGGHGVPEDVVRRRYHKSVVNFDRVYRPTATMWRVYDGGVAGALPIVAHGRGDTVVEVLDRHRWQRLRAAAERSTRRPNGP